ncbi:hypothetical protein ALC56_14955, partial [Trachymyrmex septentrionalis]
YTLIEFISDKKKESVDCVPSNWIFFNGKEGTSFLPRPYTIKKCQEFHDVVKAQRNPDSKWSSCAILVKEEVDIDSYEDALQRLDRLKNANYAFTTDCDSD